MTNSEVKKMKEKAEVKRTAKYFKMKTEAANRLEECAKKTEMSETRLLEIAIANYLTDEVLDGLMGKVKERK